ncbi:MAG: HAD family hydrolase [Eubacterium sp.]|nr:HAD family hydrolase [Eubacterium sp.]
MIRAVIFDMFETLITHYQSTLYFGSQMAADAGIAEEHFQAMWQQTDRERTVGNAALEEVLADILRVNGRYSEELLGRLVQNRTEAKRECFRHLHPQILPMLSGLKERGMLTGLISNCFSEEARVIRESILFPYLDAVFLSWEQGVAKPDKEIFVRCMNKLGVTPEECLYVGDGGSGELEAAKEIGMKAAQAVWYLTGHIGQQVRKPEFVQLECPFDLWDHLSEEKEIHVEI